MHRAVEGRQVRLADGSELFGDTLERLLHATFGYRRVMQSVERRGHARDVIEALLDRDVRDRSFFDNQGAVENMALQLTTPIRDVQAVREDEHNAWQLRIEDRSNGYPRVDHIGLSFIASGEYRTLQASYGEIRDVVRAHAQGSDRDQDRRRRT